MIDEVRRSILDRINKLDGEFQDFERSLWLLLENNMKTYTVICEVQDKSQGPWVVGNVETIIIKGVQGDWIIPIKRFLETLPVDLDRNYYKERE